MSKFECPRCRTLAIPLRDVVTAGPATQITCPQCHGISAMPLSQFWISAPVFVAAVIVYRYTGNFLFGGAVLAIGGAMAAAVTLKWLRLEPI